MIDPNTVYLICIYVLVFKILEFAQAKVTSALKYSIEDLFLHFYML